MTVQWAIRGWRRRAARAVAVRYLAFLAALNLVWEFAQMPLYTIGQSGSRRDIVLAGLHCTAGDVMIGGVTLLAALLVSGPAAWPEEGRLRVIATAVAFGLAFTVFSEWLNVEIRGA